MPGNKAPYKSKNTQLAVGSESEQNSTVAPTRVPGIVADAAQMPDPEIDYLEDRVIGGPRTIFDKRPGQRTYEAGSVTVTPQDGWPFAYLFGKETVNTDEDVDGNSETGKDTHVFEVLNDDLPPTFTTEAVYYAPSSSSADDFVRTFGGCAVASGTLESDNESQLTVDLDIYAMSVEPGTTSTGSIDVPQTEKWIFSDASSNLEMFGSSFSRVTDFSLDLDNGLESKYYIESEQSPDPFEILYNIAEFSMDATISIDDNSIYTELARDSDDQNKFTTSIEFTRPNGDTLRVEATGCEFEDAPHEIPDDDQTIDVDVSILPEDVTVYVEDSVNPGNGSILA